MAASAPVTDHDFGDDQEPLLVRPFVLQDSESADADPSSQTWPSSETTREVPPAHAASDAEPTEIIVRPAPPPRRYRRRLLIIGATGAVVVLAAAAAGFAALRPGMNTSVPGGPAGLPLPVVTGPARSATASPSAAVTPVPDVTSAHHSGSPSAKSSATSAPAAGASASAGVSWGAAAAGPTTAPATAQPHNAAPATARTGTIRGQNGLCLDLNGGVAVDDNHVQVFTCNNTAAQSWTLATDGTLRVQGMCALIDGDSTVHIVTCDGRTTAQWRVADSTLINAADNECLTDPSSGSQSGAGVVVTACGGAADQRWSLP
jgi:hypothetical protein